VLERGSEALGGTKGHVGLELIRVDRTAPGSERGLPCGGCTGTLCAREADMCAGLWGVWVLENFVGREPLPT